VLLALHSEFSGVFCVTKINNSCSVCDGKDTKRYLNRLEGCFRDIPLFIRFRMPFTL
jgi:hypothetical protein